MPPFKINIEPGYQTFTIKGYYIKDYLGEIIGGGNKNFTYKINTLQKYIVCLESDIKCELELFSEYKEINNFVEMRGIHNLYCVKEFGNIEYIPIIEELVTISNYDRFNCKYFSWDLTYSHIPNANKLWKSVL